MLEQAGRSSATTRVESPPVLLSTFAALADLARADGQDLRSLLQQITEIGVRVTGASVGAFFFGDRQHQGERLDMIALAGAPRSDFPEAAPARDTAMFAPTFAGDTVVRIDDVLDDPRYGRKYGQTGVPKGHARVRSYLGVPVVASDGRFLGALLFSHHAPGIFTERSEEVAGALAAQAAVAIDNARLFEREQAARAEAERAVARLRELTHGLQNGMLPRRIPRLDRLEIAVRYRPAVEAAEVGGDWYDVVECDDRAVFVIGDVQGHNLEAAAVMGQLRTAVRAYLHEGHSPASALVSANRLLIGLQTELLATCALVELHRYTGEMRMARAGHPPPIAVGPGSPAHEMLLDAGLPLGFDEEAGYEESIAHAGGPFRLVMHTDGVVEHSADGSETLLELLDGSDGWNCEDVADRILGTIDRQLRDDAAVLVVDYAGPADEHRVTALSFAPHAESIRHARRYVRQTLVLWGMSGDAVDQAELVTSELVTNAMRHAEARQLRMGLGMGAKGMLWVQVHDASSRRPHVTSAGADDESGRGLAIVEAVAVDWGITLTDHGKAVWAALKSDPDECL